jgi:hypothetical protein
MSNDAASEAAKWLSAAQAGRGPEQQQAAALVSMAISLDRIADALGGPRPNDAEKTYTGPVRVPTDADHDAAGRAARVSSPYPAPSVLDDAHPAVRADAEWHSAIARGRAAALQREETPNDLEDPEMH